MQTIKDILATRASDAYYQDCTQGAALQARREQVCRDSWRDHADLSVKDLTRMVRSRLPRKHRLVLDRRAFRKGELLDILADLLGAEAVEAMAEEFGCAEYECCIQCPRGQELAATEIYAYAMGGA